jgi:hypothetical protein
MANDLPRCPRCGYSLIHGVCPIHEGRQVSERLPMPAPLPRAREADTSSARVLRFARKRRGAA